MSTQQSDAILVVGTGRSGTSAMAGSLQRLGAYLGGDLKAGDAVNRKGYFENTRITDRNKAILLEAGVSWYGSIPGVDDAHAVPVTAARCAMIREGLAEIFGTRSPIVIKDPRLCVLLESYVEVLRDMGFQIHVVRMHRTPQEVASSMTSATGIDATRWLPLVHRYIDLLDVALQRTAVPVLDCTFEDLIAHPESTMQWIAARWPFLSADDGQLQEVRDFIDGSLRHHGV